MLTNPNTIYIGGPITHFGRSGRNGDGTAKGEIMPGHLLEPYNEEVDDIPTMKYRVHSTADQTPGSVIVAFEQSYMGKGIDTAYADGDLVYGCIASPGAELYMWVGSGANISAVGSRLQSAGNGMLKADASGDGRFEAMEVTDGAVTENTRLHVRVV